MHGAARAIVELDLVSPTSLDPVDRFHWVTARNCLIGLLNSNDYEFVEPVDDMGRHLSTKIRRRSPDAPRKAHAQRHPKTA